MIETVGILSKPGRPDLPAILKPMVDWLESRGISYRPDSVTAEYLGRSGGFDRSRPDDVDLLIVLGGDGTLLSAARGVGDREIPLLAVNLGGLGFLMTTGPQEILAALERVFAGDYAIQSRIALLGELRRDDRLIGSYFALNDIVLNKAAIARLLHVDVYVNDDFMCSYRSDGLIVATPTGSTAYSLAAGGPIMLPSVEALCLTPICPHALSNRPVVVPETARIEVLLKGGDDSTFLTVDGQVGVNLQVNDKIVVEKAAHEVKIVQPLKVRFFDVLRSKMQWGGR